MRVLFAGPDPDLVMETTGEDRKPGLHLSDITGRMAYEKDQKLNPNNPLDRMTLERGFTWERIVEIALNARHKRPGYRPEQIQEDGIWMSPDWVNPDADIQVEEWKATKKGMKRGFEDVGWHWMPNSMAYLRALLKRKIATRLAVRFRIWWINGDYSFESKSSDFHLLQDYWKVDVEFSKRELEEKWGTVLSAGKRFGLLKEEPWQKTKAKDSKELPPSRGRAPRNTSQSTKPSRRPRSGS